MDTQDKGAPENTVRLGNIGGGIADELFDAEFSKVLRNVRDPNTNPTKARKITLTITLTPNKDRNGGHMSVDVSSKLAPVQPSDPVMIYLGKSKTDGRLVAVQHDLSQIGLFESTASPNVVAIDGGKAKEGEQ